MKNEQSNKYDSQKTFQRYVSLFGAVASDQAGLITGIPAGLAASRMKLAAENRGLFYDEAQKTLYQSETETYKSVKPLWVYLDLRERGITGKAFAASEPYAVITFYSKKEHAGYEIFYVPAGMEIAAADQIRETVSREYTFEAVVILERPERMEAFDGINIRYFCTVSNKGVVDYYE